MAQNRETLLEMVQDISREMSSFKPNNINDQEARDIAETIKETYSDLASIGRIPKTDLQFRLVASGDADLPIKMTIPEGINDLYKLYYNKKETVSAPDAFRKVDYRTPTEFIELSFGRDSTSTDVEVVTDGDATFNVLTNRHPTYYTTWNQEDLYFDSYYSALDDTLQASKTRCYGKQLPTFTIEADFVPVMSIDTARMVKAEAKARCFAIIKQVPNQKIELEANRLRVFSQRHKGIFPEDRQHNVNYGRK